MSDAPVSTAVRHDPRCLRRYGEEFACSCGAEAPTTPDAVAEVMAFHWQGFRETLVGALKNVSDDLLSGAIPVLRAHEDGDEPRLFDMLAYLAQCELDSRRVVRRAREVGSEVYCVYHDGDMKACAHHHFAEEEP